jgi:hypothetical protein
MPDFYFILFLKRLDADEKRQYFQLPYIPCRMDSYHMNENLERFPPIGNILSVLLGILKLL